VPESAGHEAVLLGVGPDMARVCLKRGGGGGGGVQEGIPPVVGPEMVRSECYCVCVRVCVCMCTCVRCVCVCVCV